MNKSIDLTIIIVNYNTKQLLEACLNSIIKNQAQTNIKIRVVDNASTDESSKLINKKYGQTRFRSGLWLGLDRSGGLLYRARLIFLGRGTRFS